MCDSKPKQITQITEKQWLNRKITKWFKRFNLHSFEVANITNQSALINQKKNNAAK